MKKNYSSDIVYSKICQKNKQPLILNNKTKKSVEFYNYTTNSPRIMNVLIRITPI